VRDVPVLLNFPSPPPDTSFERNHRSTVMEVDRLGVLSSVVASDGGGDRRA
jgi:hypothetical protein